MGFGAVRGRAALEGALLGFGEEAFEAELVIEVQLDGLVGELMEPVADVVLVPEPQEKLRAQEALRCDKVGEVLHRLQRASSKEVKRAGSASARRPTSASSSFASMAST